MAVKLHDYFEHYSRRTLSYFVLIHILSSVLAGLVAWLLWQHMEFEPLMAFTVSTVALTVLNIVVAFVLFKIASQPHKVLTQAIAHISKDPVVTPPPDINKRVYQKNGLKDMVQTVYELALGVFPAEQGSEDMAAQLGLFRSLLDNLPAGVIAMDTTGRVLYANHGAPVTLNRHGGYDVDLIFEHHDDFKTWLANCQTKKVRDTHFWQRVADKLPSEAGRRIFDVAAYYQKNDAYGIEAVLVAFDRTGTYAPDQDDMDFIALAAHELRAPITVIRGYLDIMAQEFGDTLTPDQQQLVDRLQVSGERLAGYVNNILNVSRYDRDQFKVHLHEENLLEIFKSLVPELALRARTQNRKLTFHISPDLPTIATDRSSITEVITNLIDNAIKYSYSGGEVTIAATLKDDFVEVTVADTGIGMPTSVIGNLFNRFYRSHRSRQAVGGTGLGLYICKAIIDAHGGTIWVRSTEGKGSTFGFTLPTYASVADKLKSGDNNSEGIVRRSEGWIKNHAMYRR